MSDTPTFATFPAVPADLLPGAGPQHSADFDAMKRSFEAVSLTGASLGASGAPSGSGLNAAEKKQRYTGSPRTNGSSAFPQAQHIQAQVQQAAQPLSYAEMYGNGLGAPTYAQNGLYGHHLANAMPFIPASQQQHAQAQHSPGSQGAYSIPGSPSYTPSNIPFGSPTSQSGTIPTMAASYASSSYGPGYDTTPSSPNPYANPYAASMGSPLAFGNQFLGLMPGMLGMGLSNPQLAAATVQLQQQQQGGYAMGYPVVDQNSMGMNGGSSTTHSGRTVYVGNLPSDASVDELLNQVRFGPIDSVKILPEKSCAFISFLDPTTAAAFHSDALMRKIRLHDQDLKIGWGKPSSVPANILAAVQQNGATRNVYLGNLEEDLTEQSLRDELSRFGPIDQVKIVRDKAIGFVHFLSIATAIKVVQTLATEAEWAGRRVNFGKDRCAYVPKNQHQQQQHNMAAAAMGSLAASYGGYGMNGFGSPNFGFDGINGYTGINANGDPNMQPGNRTVYLGNIHPETTTDEICNIIRGGILQQIRYIPDKHICFVTFVDASCALAFYQTAAFQGISLHNRRLKVGWGKPSGPTPPGIAMVVQSGGSRNVYIGNIEDFEEYNEDRLRRDFGEYGDIELVNSLPPKNASFVNFTNIANAIKAIEGIKQHPDYQGFRISYGKDRCGGTPKHHNFARPAHFQHQHNQNHANVSHSTAEQGLGLVDTDGSPAEPNVDQTTPPPPEDASSESDGSPLEEKA